jgi:hypothetical protein
MSGWDPGVLGERIAPGFSAFTAADVPDLRDRLPQVGEWLSDWITSSVRPPTPSPMLLDGSLCSPVCAGRNMPSTPITRRET